MKLIAQEPPKESGPATHVQGFFVSLSRTPPAEVKSVSGENIERFGFDCYNHAPWMNNTDVSTQSQQ